MVTPSIHRGRKHMYLDLHAAERAYWPQMFVRTSVRIVLVGSHTLTAQERLRLVRSHMQLPMKQSLAIFVCLKLEQK